MHFDTNKTLILSNRDVQRIIREVGVDQLMDAVIKRLNEAIISFDSARTVIPVRSGFQYKTPNSGLIEWMPLLEEGGDVLIKIVGYHPANPEIHGLPTIVSTISAYDTSTGHLKMVMDGMFATALRTGAASAVASRVLAHPETSVLGLIGCGTQAVTQLHALSRVFDLKTVLLYDTDRSAVDSMSDRCRPLNLDVVFLSSEIESIVESSDILCTQTSIEVGLGPLFKGITPIPHTHINAVGSDLPGKMEIPIGLLKRSFVCPDFKDQAILEGECQQLDPEDIGDDLAAVIRHPDDFVALREQNTVFDSTGWVLEDQVVLDLFLGYSRQLGLGKEIEIEAMPKDAKNPYQFALDLGEPGLHAKSRVAILTKKIH